MEKIRYSSDTLPPLADEQRRRLAELAAKRDDQIDTDDATELTDAQMADASRGRFYRPLKQQITARLDADVLAWLKSQGKGYQSRMNAILREAMLKSE